VEVQLFKDQSRQVLYTEKLYNHRVVILVADKLKRQWFTA